jgi:hypothetical protein
MYDSSEICTAQVADVRGLDVFQVTKHLRARKMETDLARYQECGAALPTLFMCPNGCGGAGFVLTRRCMLPDLCPSCASYVKFRRRRSWGPFVTKLVERGPRAVTAGGKRYTLRLLHVTLGTNWAADNLDAETLWHLVERLYIAAREFYEWAVPPEVRALRDRDGRPMCGCAVAPEVGGGEGETGRHHLHVHMLYYGPYIPNRTQDGMAGTRKWASLVGIAEPHFYIEIVKGVSQAIYTVSYTLKNPLKGDEDLAVTLRQVFAGRRRVRCYGRFYAFEKGDTRPHCPSCDAVLHCVGRFDWDEYYNWRAAGGEFEVTVLGNKARQDAYYRGRSIGSLHQLIITSGSGSRGPPTGRDAS